MSEHNRQPTVNLKIWQQNLNTSLIAQESLLNNPDMANWDILILQEPHINFLRNTRANHKWHVLYPTQHYTHPLQRLRAVILISAALDTNAWKQLPFPSSDVVILQLSGAYGTCSILNIYNDCGKQDTLMKLVEYLDQHIITLRPTADDHMLWMGDFNRHHPLWEEICNRHLFNYITAQPLIDLIADYGMLQLLPIGLPTLQSCSTGNWTRPDNIFGTEQLLDGVITCTTAPELRGPKTDHVPIHLTLALETPRTDTEPKRNWREVDWPSP
jgi:endonuclease/exonuclease/phosphatase family metal-dependent hydrolase